MSSNPPFLHLPKQQTQPLSIPRTSCAKKFLRRPIKFFVVRTQEVIREAPLLYSWFPLCVVETKIWSWSHFFFMFSHYFEHKICAQTYTQYWTPKIPKWCIIVDNLCTLPCKLACRSHFRQILTFTFRRISATILVEMRLRNQHPSSLTKTKRVYRVNYQSA